MLSNVRFKSIDKISCKPFWTWSYWWHWARRSRERFQGGQRDTSGLQCNRRRSSSRPRRMEPHRARPRCLPSTRLPDLDTAVLSPSSCFERLRCWSHRGRDTRGKACVGRVLPWSARWWSHRCPIRARVFVDRHRSDLTSRRFSRRTDNIV